MSAFCVGARLDGVQFLTGLEPDSLSWSDADFGAGAGIATDSGFAGADAENAKSAQFDALAAAKACFRPSKTVSTAASALVRGRPVRSMT